MVRRLPFKRGFNNIFRIEYQEINIAQLDTLDAGVTVTTALLADKVWIGDPLKPVVVLGDGELSKKLTVRAHRFTKSAQEKIDKAGGSTEKIEQKVIGARVTVKLLTRDKLAKLNAE